MAAGGLLAGMMVGNNLERLKAGLAAASVAWKDLEPRGLALGIEAMSGIPALASKQRPTLGGTVAARGAAPPAHRRARAEVCRVPARARRGRRAALRRRDRRRRARHRDRS